MGNEELAGGKKSMKYFIHYNPGALNNAGTWITIF